MKEEISSSILNQGDIMNVSLVGKQLELTQPMKDHIENAIDALKKYNLDIISTRVVVSPDENKGFSIEFSINVAYKNTIVIKQENKDMYTGVDLAIERVKKVMRRYHDKITDYRVEQDTIEYGEDIDEIIPMELELYKPLALEDATEVLKDSKRDFLVYNDYDNNVRVLLKDKGEVQPMSNMISDENISIEEGLKLIKNSGENLSIFTDEDNKTRVLHKVRNNLFQIY